MSYLKKRGLSVSALPLILLDVVAVVVSFWLALAFRFDGHIPVEDDQFMLLALPAIVGIYRGLLKQYDRRYSPMRCHRR